MAIFLVELEPVETRYTAQWQTHIPSILEKQGHFIQRITCHDSIPNAVTPGAFLNFGGTNIFKAEQVKKIGELFCKGIVQPGDHFLFYDAWHPGIINLKYMSELLQVPVTTHALWHAGSYDPQDFLGRLIGNAHWVRHAEKSFFHAIDHNYFATDFHIKMFFDNLLHDDLKKENPWYEDDFAWSTNSGKIIRSGWPMEYMEEVLRPYRSFPKRDLILFPHRIAPEKQVEIFKDLATHLPQYEWIVCQEHNLSKDEYHRLLGEAKIVFSANLQETLGISMYEGVLVDTIPMVPDRLSYSEMYEDIFKYPSVWTESFESYESYRQDICKAITDQMDFYRNRLPWLKKQAKSLTRDFFSADELYKGLKINRHGNQYTK